MNKIQSETPRDVNTQDWRDTDTLSALYKFCIALLREKKFTLSKLFSYTFYFKRL